MLPTASLTAEWDASSGVVIARRASLIEDASDPEISPSSASTAAPVRRASATICRVASIFCSRSSFDPSYMTEPKPSLMARTTRSGSRRMIQVDDDRNRSALRRSHCDVANRLVARIGENPGLSCRMTGDRRSSAAATTPWTHSMLLTLKAGIANTLSYAARYHGTPLAPRITVIGQRIQRRCRWPPRTSLTGLFAECGPRVERAGRLAPSTDVHQPAERPHDMPWHELRATGHKAIGEAGHADRFAFEAGWQPSSATSFADMIMLLGNAFPRSDPRTIQCRSIPTQRCRGDACPTQLLGEAPLSATEHRLWRRRIPPVSGSA